MKRIIHYILYPFWKIDYWWWDNLGLGSYTDETLARMSERTTWKYESPTEGGMK